MSNTTTMTEEKKAAMEKDLPIYRDKWINLFMSGKDIDREAFEKGITEVYSWCGFPKPYVVYTKSTIGMQYACSLFKDIAETTNTKVKDEKKAMKVAYDQTVAAMESVSVKQIIETFRSDSKFKHTDTSVYGNYTDYGWVSYGDYYTKYFDIDPEIHKKFKTYQAFIESAFFDMIQLKGVVFVCPLPIIKKNNDNRLHSTTGGAVVFPDGYKQHYINGRFLPEDLFEKFRTGKITSREYNEISNADYKGAAFEIMGHDKILALLDVKQIDHSAIAHANGDVEDVYLYEMKKPDKDLGYPLKFVKFICPSTGTNYIEAVQEDVKTAVEAMARRSNFPIISQNPENYKAFSRN